MPRTTQQQQPPTRIAANVLSTAKNDFLALQPQIVEVKERLKQLKKEEKEIKGVIMEHMEDEAMTEMNVGTFVFQRAEVESCRFSEKKLVDFVEQSVLDTYKEKFTETKWRFKVNKQRESQDSQPDV